MKFAHMADCHIGGWNDPKMRELGIRAFEKAVAVCLHEKVDFVVVAGDLFNTALPGIEVLTRTVKQLRLLKDNLIPFYVVAGSHDYSPSGKSILNVLETAGLLVNVEGKVVGRGIKLFGMAGKKAGLEKSLYYDLEREKLENEAGPKIFVMHSAIEEFKPVEMMHAVPLKLIPKGFDYYACGHVHYIFQKKVENYGVIAFPGPLFPNNFAELEELSCGFYLVDCFAPRFVPVKMAEVVGVKLDCGGKSPQEVTADLLKVAERDLTGCIITLRLFGELRIGKPSEIDFKQVFRVLYSKGAYHIMRNTAKLTSKEFEVVEVSDSTVEEIEHGLIAESAGKIKVDGWSKESEERLVGVLMRVLDREREEGERVNDFESRIRDDVLKLLT
ncbi:MAG: DNA repair exonuclease [Candidatus Woesearchaeota archaeon]